MELVVAVDQNMGIGYQNKLPWYCQKELQHFKSLTENSCLIVGANTAISLPKLENRKIVCLVHNHECDDYILSNSKNDLQFITNLSEYSSNMRTFIAGGAYTYQKALEMDNFVSTIHLSIIKGTHTCDKFFDPKLLRNFVIINAEECEEFCYYQIVKTKDGEQQYLDLLGKIVNSGNSRDTRNAITKSLFVEHFIFDLTKGFPLLTTKKMFFRGIIEEFLFFIRGSTDSKLLSQKNVNIWIENTTPEFIESRGLPYAEGIMGPMYGYQWRHFGSKYIMNENGIPKPPEGGVDQLQNVIDLINNDPKSRRIMMTTYNPLQAEEGVLYPCHSICIQFYVDDEYLDMFCYNRSQDTFLGVPYNIASSSLLLMTIAKITNKIPRFFKMSMGDTHLYESHLEQAKIQINKLPYKLPTIKIPNISSIEDLEKCTANDFLLENYVSHQKIIAKMIA